MAKRLQNGKENNINYACRNDDKCQVLCNRIGIWRSQSWFNGWVQGQPDKKEDCPDRYYEKTLLDLALGL